MTRAVTFALMMIEPLMDNNKKLALRVSYPLVVEEGFHFGLSMNTDDASRELYTLPMRIEGESSDTNTLSTPIKGENTIIKPVIINDLEVGVNYHIQISIGNGYGDDIVTWTRREQKNHRGDGS